MHYQLINIILFLETLRVCITNNNVICASYRPRAMSCAIMFCQNLHRMQYHPRIRSREMQYRADSRVAPIQWETALLCNDVSHWLGASLESALNTENRKLTYYQPVVTGGTVGCRYGHKDNPVPLVTTKLASWKFSVFTAHLNPNETPSQLTRDVIITSSLRQNDIATSFWRHNDVLLRHVFAGIINGNQ